MKARQEGREAKLQKLLTTQEKIEELISKPITFDQPILWHRGKPLFFPKTINVIQGKAGVHKSHLAETICAALLKKPGCKGELLEFTSNENAKQFVCYVDTERNHSQQLPYALQQILLKAGYALNEKVGGLVFISLLEFDRKDRFEMLNIYLEYLRTKWGQSLVVVLDVTTDCMGNFNDTKDSLELIDMMNQSINKYDVSFLCLIHENPGTDKARGHLGTELLNKATTLIQIGYEKDSHNSDTDLIKVSCLKCRSSKRHDPFYIKYDEDKGLISADPHSVQEILDKKNQKGLFGDIVSLLAELVEEEMPRRELIQQLMTELDCGKSTVVKRLKLIEENRIVIEQKGRKCVLSTDLRDRKLNYKLKPL